MGYLAAGRPAEAIRQLDGMLTLAESKLGPDHPRTLTFRNNLAAAYEAVLRWADAEPLQRGTLARRRKTEAPGSPFLADDLDDLGRNLMSQARWSEAEPLLREALAIRVKTAPDDWRRFNTMSLLGGVLVGQGRYAEAGPLVVSGYEGMEAREPKVLPASKGHLTAAGGRVVRLYEAWEKPEQAAAWRARLGPEMPNGVGAFR
jgi:hypothetical protein